MKKEQVLKTALKVLAERGKTHGEACDNMRDIAKLWSVYLGIQLTSKDVCVLNILQKVARMKCSAHSDNPVDIAGYAAIMGEVPY